LELLSRQPGWRRSTRCELVFKKESIDEDGNVIGESCPKFLALHEFEEGSLPGTKVSAAVPPFSETQTPWGKRVMGSAKGVDAAIFRLLKGFGRQDAALGEGFVDQH